MVALCFVRPKLFGFDGRYQQVTVGNVDEDTPIPGQFDMKVIFYIHGLRW